MTVRYKHFPCLLSIVLSLLVATSARADKPAVAGVLTSLDTISVVGTANATTYVYKIKAGSTSCGQTDIDTAGNPLNFSVGGGASVSSTTISPTPVVLKLTTPTVAGDVLCLTASMTAGGSESYAIALPLAVPPSSGAIPATEPSFAHSFYTVGAVISNQLSTSNSTTAAQYVDLGFSFKFRTEGDKHAPGFNTSLAGRFTSIPVAAGGAAVTPPDTSTPLNVLSSQESARIMGTAFLPFRVSKQTSDGDALFLGPVARASFSTLINPSQAVAPATGTVLIAPHFAPTYNDWSLGGRMGWRRYPSDDSVQTVWQIEATMGKFSNLQDIFCNHKFPTTGQPAPTNTSCYDTPVTSTSPTTYTTYRTDRVSNPRLEIDGFARIPGTIFVLGIDANLSQYGFHKANTDTMNRAGSDVRIYFGITGSISDLFKKLNLPSTP